MNKFLPKIAGTFNSDPHSESDSDPSISYASQVEYPIQQCIYIQKN